MHNVFVFFIFYAHRVYQCAIQTSCGSVLLRHGLNFSTAWWTMQLISGEKDWKHVSVQKVVTLNICCNVACLTFHMPHITTGFYRATACNATHGIAVGMLSVRPSIRLSVRPSDACIVTKLNDALHIFLYDTKGQSFCYSDTNSAWLVGDAPFRLNFALNVTQPPLEKRWLRQISAYNVSTVKQRKKSIMTNEKSTMGFPMECVRYPKVLQRVTQKGFLLFY